MPGCDPNKVGNCDLADVRESLFGQKPTFAVKFEPPESGQCVDWGQFLCGGHSVRRTFRD